MPVQRRLDTYHITDRDGRLIETFQIDLDGTAAICAAEAHLLDRAIRRIQGENSTTPADRRQARGERRRAARARGGSTTPSSPRSTPPGIGPSP